MNNEDEELIFTGRYLKGKYKIYLTKSGSLLPNRFAGWERKRKTNGNNKSKSKQDSFN